MSGLLLPVCAIFFSILLCNVYFWRERVHLLENNMYACMIICSVFDSIIVTILQIIALDYYPETSYFWVSLLNKIDFSLLIVISNCILFYVMLITIPKIKKFYRKFFLPFIIIDILMFISIFISKVDVISFGGNYSAGGPSVLIAEILCACYLIATILVVLFNLKKVDKRHIFVFVMLFLLLGLIIVVKINPYLIFTPIVVCFVNYIMYFTIENPDVKMIEQLNIARDQADKANRAKTEFLSNMSHEIRTPLNAIVGFSNLLLENKDMPENAKDEIKDIIMAGDNLLEIVNGILDISKIEANKMEIEAGEYSFKKLANELVTLTKGRIAEKPLEFKVSIDETIPPVLYGDAQKVKQICVNVLTNAVKYTKEGWIELKISHVAKDGVCRLIISVEDTGIGIKEGNIERIFDKFDRLDVDDNVTIEGTGLGLAITKKLLDMMHGKIVVQSTFGKGSKFTVSIDQKIVKNPTIKIDEDKKITEKVQVSQEKLVLIVDDNKINLKVAERLLESYGIKSVSVDNGYDAITKIKNGEKYDLILMDDMMPKLSGTETFHELQKIDGFNIPVIALTANALTGEKEKYLAEGFNDYLAKPINKDELNNMINKYLNQE